VRIRGRSLVCLLAVAAGGCLVDEPAPEVGSHRFELTVSDYHTGTCSTAVVLALSMQIAEEVHCLAPDALVPFEEGGGIVFVGSAVLPYVSAAAKADLQDAVAAHGGELRVTSGFRTVAQQYLLRKWFELGRCGITAAAQPGSSNHQSGRALDISNYGEWSSILPMYGWAQTVLPHDPVHFDHLGSPDNRGLDVLAFQRLWNRNHPGDPIAEDGLYGPQTAARLAAAPAGGFELGACDPYDFGAEYLAGDVPARLDAGARAQVSLELRNTGGTTWTPEATYLATVGPMDRASALFDEQTWLSPGRPTAVDAAVAPGEIGRFTFTARAPLVGTDLLVSEAFGLVDDGGGAPQWFGPDDLRLEIEVIGDGKSDDPGFPPATDEPDHHGPADVIGGCAAGGPGAPIWLVLLALPFLRRRRAADRRL
jgi:hypothetical protein